MHSIYRQVKYSGMAALALTMLAAVMILAGMARPAQAQTYSALYNFGVVDSSQNGPNGQLALGRDGNFYGTINQNRSEIYQITPGGVETLLWESPQSGYQEQCYNGLTLGSDGLLYGTCNLWDDNLDNGGVIFKFDPSQGAPTVVYKFPYCSQNTYGLGPLTLGTDGNLYGTTTGNNACPGSYTYGTFFKITPAGQFTLLHVFQGIPEPGTPSGPLTLGANGNFYGTSQIGGNPDNYNGGTVYQITPKGKVTLLYSFPNTGPYFPVAGVTQGADGKFYGTTYYGGTGHDGTVFQLVSAGKINVLHNFSYVVDNAGFPNFPLTLGTDGSLYAPSLTFNMGGYGPESLFKITTKGVYADLYNLLPAACAQGTHDGCMLSSPMVLHPNGTFYGTAAQGGSVGRGVFYGLNTGLKPYIILQFPLGNMGTTLGIFGQGFTTATAVEFNGTLAAFKVVSDTYLTATIPAGATTGYVTVTESSGTLKSSIKFAPKLANPMPAITSLSPNSAIAGGAGFTLTVNGTGFISTSVVKWAGSPRTTTLVNANEITATINAADITKAGTFKVTVTNPAPGGGTSAASNFVVDNPVPTLTSISPSSATHGGAAFTLTATGTNYISGSKIEWNGTKLTTTYVSGTTLTATVPVADIKTAGTASVTVFNPTPGGGTSAAKTFTIN
jgi:uncharacterized repeat protein (TIGR03803 family)